jgi:hypothetical protein
VLFDGGSEEPNMLVHAQHHDLKWRALLSANALEQAITQAADGISTDLDAAGQQLAVRSGNDAIEIEFGPFLVHGTVADWKGVMERERADAQPHSQAPTVPEPAPWDRPRQRFPVTSSEW